MVKLFRLGWESKRMPPLHLGQKTWGTSACRRENPIFSQKKPVEPAVIVEMAAPR